jgi:hypothetical protein
MVDTTRRLIGAALWTGDRYARAHYTRVVDPDIARCLDAGQAAYIYRGGVTYMQVKRLLADTAELPGPAQVRPPARPQLPAAPAGPLQPRPPAAPTAPGPPASPPLSGPCSTRSSARRRPDETRHGCRWMAHRSGHKPWGVPSTGPASQPGPAGSVRGGDQMMTGSAAPMHVPRPLRDGGPFELLSPPASAAATDEDVRAAWRRIAAATHPDRPDGGDAERFAAASAARQRSRSARIIWR